MNQCDAQTLPSTYTETHRCLKRTGLKKIGKLSLCGHHRSMRERRAGLKAGGACRKTS